MLDRELFDFLEHTSDAAFTLNERAEICSWNRAAEQLFGYSAAEALQKTCYSLLQGKGSLGTQVCRENCSVQECASKHLPIPNFDLEVRTRSGSLAWVNMSTLVFVGSRNHGRMIVHLAHDIAERKENEEILRKMIELSKEMSSIPDVVGRPAPISPLSEQEREILQMLSVGKDSEAIAEKLGITLQTLRNHLHHVNQKLHTHSRLEAVTNALQRKLI